MTDEELTKIPAFNYEDSAFDPVIRVLRGSKMGSRLELMREFGAALQFFEGFGENWHALQECLFDLDEWLPARSYILVFTQPWQILAEEDDSQLKWLLVTLSEAGDWWSKPILDNGQFNRPAIPFHSVFQCLESEVDRLPSRIRNLPVLGS